ncbi:MAG: ABC transporter substrate-binding protein [Actinobacteria bacterium]|nr:ABC transporter substrate-binding protein [Actinomycetota bacterium]
MATPIDALRRMQTQPTLPVILGVGAATLSLLLASVVGAVYVSGEGGDQEVATARADDDLNEFGFDKDTTEALPEGSVPQADGTFVAPDGSIRTADGTVVAPPGSAKPSGPGTTAAKPGAAKPSPGDRTGVTDTMIKWGLHAPKTFDGAPLNLAEDPLEGTQIYTDALNEAGGIHGRKIELRIADDRYTVSGGRQAANELINDYKAFFVSGTLGVDQIFQVAAEARKQGVPYIAGGGSESVFKDIGMFQSLGSYDTHLSLLADMLGAESKKPAGQSIYSGLTKVGVSALDSPYITPSVETFRAALKRNGLELVAVVKVQKPTEQTSYASQIQALRDAGTEIFVPAQDPITTSRQVAECVSQRCPWKYAASNFAHESNTALSLMGKQWVGVKALSGGCYYIHPNEGNKAQCGQLKRAREEWIKQNGQDDWVKDGQGGIAGYQFVHVWTKAMQDAGPDPTRERLTAALLSYRGYDNLVTAPLTFSGSDNLSHGYEKVVIYEAQSNDQWRQLGPGFTDQF